MRFTLFPIKACVMKESSASFASRVNNLSFGTRLRGKFASFRNSVHNMGRQWCRWTLRLGKASLLCSEILLRPLRLRHGGSATFQRLKIKGPWEVSFDPRWGGPERVIFDRLEDWTERHEEGIRYYSGMATYRNSFDYVAA